MLTLVPTPIGNRDDITLRALETFREADVVACEDTRKTGHLLRHHGIEARKLVPFHEHNERGATGRLLERMRAGERVALATNAGTPGVSDPGFRLVRAAIEAEVPVSALPGPTALVPALVASGLPVASFTFHGFPPRKPGRLRHALEREREAEHTQIYYESPHRLLRFLDAAGEVFGDRNAAVCRELTKAFETIHRGRISALREAFARTEARGEAVVVIEGFKENGR